MSVPWTQVLRLRWDPELKFYEQRIFLLRELEAREALDAFRVEDHEVEARLSEESALQLRPTGATLSLIGPEADVDAGREALALVVKSLDPLNIVGEWLSLQFLEPLSEGFEDAKRASIERVVGRLLDSAIDYALLVDGYSDRLASAFQVEMGVISAQDAPLRIGRFVGRMGSPDNLAGVSGRALERADYPDVAFFSDWRWQLTEGVAGEDLEPIFSFWDGTVSESQALLKRFSRSGG